MIRRLIWAEMIRCVRTPTMWAIPLVGIAFTCVLSWWGYNIPSQMPDGGLTQYGDSTLGSFSTYSLFCMILGAVLVTRDYDTKIIARTVRVASGDYVLVAVKAVVAAVWSLCSTLVMTEANAILWISRLSRAGFDWQTTHGWALITSGALVLGAASGICGVALGFVLKSTPVTIVVEVVAVLILLPQLARFGLIKYVHYGLAVSLLFAPSATTLCFWLACLVEAGWCVVLIAAALTVMRIRSSTS